MFLRRILCIILRHEIASVATVVVFLECIRESRPCVVSILIKPNDVNGGGGSSVSFQLTRFTCIDILNDGARRSSSYYYYVYSFLVVHLVLSSSLSLFPI